MKKTLILFVTFFINAVQADVLKDFDGLGENKELFDTAKALHPDLNVTVVQERVVKRRNRLEISPELSLFSGGDAYIDTSSYGLTANYHITPWISIGGRYNSFTNKLNAEGENLINDMDANGQGIIPDIDFPRSSTMGFVNIYPIYGKMNTLNMGITHFDLYLSAGYGSMQLRSGTSPTWSAGGGVGLWWSQHFSTRLEVRYQTYEAQRYDQSVDIDNTVASIQMGYIL
jgi:outer membrane immunogenic protein